MTKEGILHSFVEHIRHELGRSIAKHHEVDQACAECVEKLERANDEYGASTHDEVANLEERLRRIWNDILQSQVEIY